MPVLLACTCGKQCSVPDSAVGQRVKCPFCGTVLTVPGAAPPSAGMLRFACRCGQQMQVPAEYAGHSISCVACKAQVVIPAAAPAAPSRQEQPAAEPEVTDSLEVLDTPAGPREERRISAERTARKRSRPPALPPEEPQQRDEERPRRRTRQPEPHRSSALACVLVLGLLVVLLGGGGVAGLLLWRSRSKDTTSTTTTTAKGEEAPAPAEQDFIPGDAQGFAAVRLAELWKHDSTQKLVKSATEQQLLPGDLSEMMRQMTGLGISDVERLTAVVVDATKNLGWGVVSTVADYDRDKILAKLQKPTEVKHEGQSYHLGSVPGGMGDEKLAVHFAGARLLVVGPEAGVKRCLSFQAGKRESGPLDEAIKRSSASKHHLFVGFNLPRSELEKLKPAFTGMGKSFLFLLDAQSGSLALDIGDTVQMAATVKFLDEKRAQQARRVFFASREGAILFLIPQWEDEERRMRKQPRDVRPMAEQLQALLEGVSVEQNGAEVTVKGKAELKALEALIRLAAEAEGRTTRKPPLDMRKKQ